MTPPAAPARALLRALAGAAVATLVLAGPAWATEPETAVVDRTNAETVDVPARAEHAQERLRRELGDAALLEIDPVTGTPRIVARLDGFLTPASPRTPETIALDYVRDHEDAFGLGADDIAALQLASSERGPDGTVHLAWRQRAGGLTDVDGGLHAAVSAEGRLLNVRGGVVPDLDKRVPEPLVSAAAAYATAMPGSAPSPPASAPIGAEHTTSFAGGGTASLVRYQDDGTGRVGWRLLLPAGSDAFYDALVDARTGALQRRLNRVHFASEINHFDVNPVAENGVLVTDEVPTDWLAPDADSLNGPFVHAVSDVDDSIHLGPGGPPFSLTEEPAAEDEVQPSSVVGGTSQWEFTPTYFCAELCTWTTANRTANREFSTAQLFWYVNTFRDHLARPPIGFTSARGAFEGDDAVLAQSLDGASTTDHRNNASMLTLPDGNRGLLEMQLFSLGRRYDGAHDAAIVYHEYTHGLTDRLVTDAEGYGTLLGPQPGALSEGFSDFYALDFLVESQPEEVPDTTTPGELGFGRWLGPLRTEGVDCTVGEVGPANACPGTATAGQGGYDYSDFGRIDADVPGEVHDNGEIWAQTLWSLRTAITGLDATPDELARVRSYVTEGLRLAPDYPTFLDMRNAILQAAINGGGSGDLTKLWEVFASRGMGWSASVDGPNDVRPSAAFDMPPPPVAPPPQSPPLSPPPQSPPPVQSPPVAKLTSLSSADLTADRKGLFKVKLRFGDNAPAGKARLTVSRKGKRLARARTVVRRGKTVTKTLRLSRKGRKVIRRGRSRKVTLVVRLPGGEKLTQTVKLRRKKR